MKRSLISGWRGSTALVHNLARLLARGLADSVEQIYRPRHDGAGTRTRDQHLLDRCLNRLQRPFRLCRYRASLVGFTKSLAREVGRVGVNVNAIAPGFIDAEMTGGLEGSARDRVIGRSALRRLAAPEDIAAMAALLMGEGGRNITGAVMTVDAGATP